MEMVKKTVTVGFSNISGHFVVRQCTDKDGTFMEDSVMDLDTLMSLLSKITKTKIKWDGYYD